MNKVHNFLIILLMLAGCTSLEVSTPTIISSTNTPALPTLTQTIEPTQTLPATLSAQDAAEMVDELLQTNGGCQLPCWWGIMPGQTSWQETEEFLYHLGAEIGQTDLESNTKFHWISFKDNLAKFNLSFIEQEIHERIVTAIFVGNNYTGYQNQEDFEIFWEVYSPKNIVKTYGVPSRILLSATSAIGLGDSGKHGYMFWIIYDALGFMIRYDGTVMDLPIYHFCPDITLGANNIHRIQIALQNPTASPIPIEWADSILANQPLRAKPIQKVTGLSLEEFYEIFAQEDMPACFDTTRDIWELN